MRIASLLLLFVVMTTAAVPPSLIDTKLLGRPRGYSGNRQEWSQWKFVFKAYIGALNGEMLRRLEVAEKSGTSMPLGGFSLEEATEARTMSYILAQTLTGSSLQLLMNVEEYNGYEAWRQLVKREEPTAGSAQVSQLTALLKTKFTGKMEYYEDEVMKFESAVLTYERTHTEIFPDTLHQALLKANAPAELRGQVEMQSYATARELREVMSAYVVSQLATKGKSAVSAPQSAGLPGASPGDMEVDYITGKKGGKKGGGKGGKSGKDQKGKGKAKTDGKTKGAKKGGPSFEGWCDNCGKWGHKAKQSGSVNSRPWPR